MDLNPHQIEAALFAFRNPFSQGAILADEVGLGDLVVIDEAHRLRNVYRNTSKIAQSIKSALTPFPKVLLDLRMIESLQKHLPSNSKGGKP